MTQACHFFLFFFGLVMLRAAEVSSFERKTFQGKFWFSTIFTCFKWFAFVEWIWTEHHACKEGSETNKRSVTA